MVIDESVLPQANIVNSVCALHFKETFDRLRTNFADFCGGDFCRVLLKILRGQYAICFSHELHFLFLQVYDLLNFRLFEGPLGGFLQPRMDGFFQRDCHPRTLFFPRLASATSVTGDQIDMITINIIGGRRLFGSSSRSVSRGSSFNLRRWR